jgi:hypothetical protein
MISLLKRVLSFLPGGCLVALSGVAIENEDKNSLVLNADGWLIEFDKPSQTVKRSKKLVASFRSVNTVDIEHFVNGRGFEWWVLSLALHGRRRLFIGRSTDGVDISIAAAHVATMISKNVNVIEMASF